MCILAVYPLTQGLSQQHEKWTAILEQMAFSFCTGKIEISHLIQAVIKQNNLVLFGLRTLSDQHIAWVGVTVNKAVDKDHFTVHLAQVF